MNKLNWGWVNQIGIRGWGSLNGKCGKGLRNGFSSAHNKNVYMYTRTLWLSAYYSHWFFWLSFFLIQLPFFSWHSNLLLLKLPSLLKRDNKKRDWKKVLIGSNSNSVKNFFNGISNFLITQHINPFLNIIIFFPMPCFCLLHVDDWISGVCRHVGGLTVGKTWRRSLSKKIKNKILKKYIFMEILDPVHDCQPVRNV
jgi:hypothetical protein